MSGWREGRTDAATDRILRAAAGLFAERGVAATGMADVAAAAGCSRATLYRYFENRRALHLAFAHLEARRVVAEVLDEVGHLSDPDERRVEAVVAAADAVRRTPHLAAWLAPGDSSLLADLLTDSPVVEELTRSFVRGDDEAGRWVLRVVLSLVAFPGQDREDERRMVRRFVTPLLGAQVTT